MRASLLGRQLLPPSSEEAGVIEPPAVAPRSDSASLSDIFLVGTATFFGNMLVGAALWIRAPNTSGTTT